MPTLGEVKTKFSTEADTSGVEQVEKRILGFSEKTVNASKTAALGLLGIATGATAMAASFVSDFTAQEDALARLEQGLINVTDDADLTAQGMARLTEQASKLQGSTRFADEMINSGQAMLTTFQLSTDTIETLTPSMLNMAEAMRKTSGETVDLSQLGIMFGKVMGNAEGGVDGMAGALKKMGVIMTEEQKAVFSYGTEAERAATLTKIMDENFAGFATAGGKTFSGQMDIMKNQFGELKEAIGGMVATALIPFVAWLTANLVPAFQNIGNFIVNNKDLFIGLGIVIATVVTPAFVAWGIAAATAAASTIIALLPLIALGTAIALAVLGLRWAWENNFLGIREITANFVAFFQSYVVPVLIGAFEFIKFGATLMWNLFVLAFTGIRIAAQAVVGFMAGVFGPQIRLVMTGIGVAVQFLKGLWDSNWVGMRETVIAVANGVISTVKNMINSVIGFFNGLISKANSIGAKVPGFVKIPEIGHLAKGTNNWKGGLTWVGEKGPELVNLPRGSQVIPNNQLAGATAPVVNQTNHIYNQIDMDKSMTELGWDLRHR